MKANLTLLLLFVATLSFGATKPERRIVLKAGSLGIFYVIVTSTNNDDLQIKYMLNDSISKNINNDELYKSTVHTFLNGNLKFEDKLALANKIDSINQKYTYYTADSLIIKKNKNPQYQQIFDTFFSSSESTEENKKNVRIVLDGLTMTFTLSEGHSTRKIYATSPSQDSHPIMYQFISQTMNLYRMQKPEGILTKGRTRGY